MVYIGFYYDVLRGEECTCFPWLKRAVGPAFFVGDALMLAVACLAGWWSRPPAGVRGAALALAEVTAFALVAYGASVVRGEGLETPPIITVNGKPFALREGRVFIYFFNPECTHCIDAAKRMAGMSWGETRIVGVATAFH